MNRLLLPVTLLLTSTLAFADPPAPKPEAAMPTPAQASAEKVVQSKLLQPLALKEHERSRFSRARLPAHARRIRVLDAEPKKDGKGAAFLSFAIDERHGFMLLGEDEISENAWNKDTITGCVYSESGEVFVQLGNTFLPAAVLIGKKTPAPAAHICKSADGQLAQN